MVLLELPERILRLLVLVLLHVCGREKRWAVEHMRVQTYQGCWVMSP